MANQYTETRDVIAIMCGERIRACRLAANNMTQAQLSRATGYREGGRTGLSPSRIANFEQGTRRVGHEEAEMLAKVFPDFPAAYFMGLLNERESAMLVLLRKSG